MKTDASCKKGVKDIVSSVECIDVSHRYRLTEKVS